MLAGALLVWVAGCASLNSVSLTPVPADRKQMIQEEVHDWVILGIAFDNDFAEGIRSKLREKCPNGKVSGILTKYESYFYVFFAKRVVTATAYCESGKKI